jgi:shikimate kinase
MNAVHKIIGSYVPSYEMPMSRTNIALIGFRATGKSKIGELIANALKLNFVDMDDALTASFAQDIKTWVTSHGWESFRRAESELLAELARRNDLVLATGGGVITSEANREILKRHFLVIWLQASPETIHARLAQDCRTTSNRPPLTDMPLQEEVKHLLMVRSPLYAEAADLAFTTDRISLQNLASQILAAMEMRNRSRMTIAEMGH